MRPKIYLILFFIFLSFTQAIFAQKLELTLEDAVLGGSKYRMTGWSNLQWSKTTNQLYYTKTGHWLYKYEPKRNRIDSIDIIKGLSGILSKDDMDKIGNIPPFELNKNNKINLLFKDKYYLIDPMDGKFVSSVDKDPNYENADKSSSGNIAYTKGNELRVRTASGKELTVAIGSDSIVFGKSVHRDEFGIGKGTFWSTDGSKLAFYRMDQSMVTKYPILQLSDTPATVHNIYYPLAGDKSHHVTVGIFDVQTGRIVYLNTGGDPEHYLTNISWSPDNKEIYIAEINRNQDHTVFNAYDIVSGNILRRLFEESNVKYTEPLESFTFIPGQSDLFLVQSKRDGWNSLYLYNRNGSLIRQLTNNIEVSELKGFDVQNKVIYFQGIPPNSIDLQFYRTEISTGNTIQLTKGPGRHIGSVSADGKYIYDQSIALGGSLKGSVFPVGKGKEVVLQQIYDPLNKLALGEIRIDTLQANDGTRLFSRTIFPVDFNPAKKYPVVIYVYGGPHAQMISNTRLGQAQLWMSYLANQGFIVFTLDNRGSSNRGMNFENVIHRHLGDIEMADQMVGYNYLLTKPWVDKTRIGVHGWSFGGFMTMSLMTRQPGKFKVAVAGGPVTDWRFYEVMYTERYMDTPQQNPEGYKNASTFNYIDQLQGSMLLIHGTSDPVVIWQQSLNYVKACVDKGKQLDYFVYPGHEHNVLGKDRVHLIRKIIDYFQEKL